MGAGTASHERNAFVRIIFVAVCYRHAFKDRHAFHYISKRSPAYMFNTVKIDFNNIGIGETALPDML